MSRRSTSRTQAAPMPTRVTRARITGTRSSRSLRVRSLESRTRRISLTSGVTTTAAATTGPASDAMPTSSTPTTRVKPRMKSSRSYRREGIGSEVYEEALGGLALLAESGCLADTLAQEIERRASGVTAPDDLDLLDPWRMHQECPLHADAVGDAPYRDLAVEPAVAHAHDRAFERLRPFAIAFHDADRDAHGVSWPDVRQAGLDLLGRDGRKDVSVVHRRNTHGRSNASRVNSSACASIDSGSSRARRRSVAPSRARRCPTRAVARRLLRSDRAPPDAPVGARHQPREVGPAPSRAKDRTCAPIDTSRRHWRNRRRAPPHRVARLRDRAGEHAFVFALHSRATARWPCGRPTAARLARACRRTRAA